MSIGKVLFIISNELNPDDLIHKLESGPEWQLQDVQLILRKNQQVFRTLEPTVVVAIIAAASAGLGALITGILSIAKEAKSKTVIIQDKEGRRLEIPADYPKEKVEKLLDAIRQMEAVKIEIP